MKKLINISIVIIFISSCGIYSFTGASIPAESRNIYVEYFTTSATNSPSYLNQTITESMKDLFLSETNLDLSESESDADLNFSGKITKYQITPKAIQANETASQNRLTIEINVEYNNSLDNKQNFQSNFSRYRDFNSSENFADLESFLIEEITKELLEDVFNKAFVNW